MNEHEALERRLSSYGRTSTPPPSERLLEQLDGDRLRGGAVDPRPRRLVRLPVLLPATAVAALVVGLVLALAGNDGPEPAIVVQTASDAVVEQSGRVAEIRAGQSLPDGAEIRTGATGSVTIGDVNLGPAERAVVRGGRLRRVERRAEIRSAPVQLELEVRRGLGGRVALRWSRYERDDFGAYVVLRDGRAVTGRRNVEGQIAIDRTRPDRSSRYVVLVLDRERKVVARSQIVMG
jgi:hypothetical protein